MDPSLSTYSEAGPWSWLLNVCMDYDQNTGRILGLQFSILNLSTRIDVLYI